MLSEIPNVRPLKDEPSRRWFQDEYFDLVIWEDAKHVVGFQLCYDKGLAERDVTWQSETGFKHNAVDDGENEPGRYKATPILIVDGNFDHETVATRFLGHSGSLDAASRDFIYQKLLEYPDR